MVLVSRVVAAKHTCMHVLQMAHIGNPISQPLGGGGERGGAREVKSKPVNIYLF